MKISFAAEGHRVQVREDINAQAREMYKAAETAPARALVSAVAQEIARSIDEQKEGSHVQVLVEVDIDVKVGLSEEEDAAKRNAQ